MMVPIDDDHFFRMSNATKRATKSRAGSDTSARAPAASRNGQPRGGPPPSPFPERASRANDYYIDRE